MAPAHITCVVLDARQHRIVVGDERGTIGCYYFETGVLQKSWSSEKPAAITTVIYGGEVGEAYAHGRFVLHLWACGLLIGLIDWFDCVELCRTRSSFAPLGRAA